MLWPNVHSSQMLTRCVTCAVLNGVGDVFCQLFVEQHDFDANRFIKFSILVRDTYGLSAALTGLCIVCRVLSTLSQSGIRCMLRAVSQSVADSGSSASCI